MLSEIIIHLEENSIVVDTMENSLLFGKALAIDRIINSDHPEQLVYLTGYTPLCEAGLGFSGKLGVFSISKIGNNLQGSRSGGLINTFLRKLGILGINIIGNSKTQQILHIDHTGKTSLIPLSEYGGRISGVFDLAMALYHKHGKSLALALTDPVTTGFAYNAIVCNTRMGEKPNRTAARATSPFGKNGLVGVVVEQPSTNKHKIQYDKKAVASILRKINKTKKNITLVGSIDPEKALLGGTYGSAAAMRFDKGYGLTNLFRSANVPDQFYESLLPDSIIQQQIELSNKSQIKLSSHSCVPGCPNKCVRMVVLGDTSGNFRIGKAGEWETYMAVINLGIFEDTVAATSQLMAHSNNFAYDHIEGLVTIAALALVTEIKEDTGVRYGDFKSIVNALKQAQAGDTELGQLIRKGTAAVEQYYGLKRHFTVGGHALPFHNGRAMLQTGVGLSWTYGRHGESCAGPGRQNFFGHAYDPSDQNTKAETHVLNTIHGMIMYGAMDELGLCFFMGPSVDSLVDNSIILNEMGISTNPNEMILQSAKNLEKIHTFNQSRGVEIQALPDVFYQTPTFGNDQRPSEAVAFTIPFNTIKDYGAEVLNEVVEGKATIPNEILESSMKRYDA
jgi:aldehyde:ferredoxin oxidoreductase